MASGRWPVLVHEENNFLSFFSKGRAVKKVTLGFLELYILSEKHAGGCGGILPTVTLNLLPQNPPPSHLSLWWTTWKEVQLMHLPMYTPKLASCFHTGEEPYKSYKQSFGYLRPMIYDNTDIQSPSQKNVKAIWGGRPFDSHYFHFSWIF